MSLQELEFYKCKLCTAKLLAGKYCIDCAKDKLKLKKAKGLKNCPPLNTKQPQQGYPFIDRNTCTGYGSNEQFSTGASTVQPIWTNFTGTGATATTSDSLTAFTGSSTVDFNSSTTSGFRQNWIPSKGKKNRHQ